MKGMTLALGVIVAGFVALSVLKWAYASFLVARGLRARRPNGMRDVERLAAYHAGQQVSPTPGTIDARSAADLDLDSVQHAIDRTASVPGAQYLYHRLRAPIADTSGLRHFDDAVSRVQRDPALASRIRGSAALLDQPGAAHLVLLFQGELPAPIRFRWIYPLISLAMLGLIVTANATPRAWLLVLALGAINYVINMSFKSRIHALLPALRALPHLAAASERLASIDAPELEQYTLALRERAPRLRTLKKAARWLLFEPGEAHELVASLFEYANMLFLAGVNALAIGLEQVRRRRHDIEVAWESLAALDLAQSVAQLRTEQPEYGRPEFTPRRKALEVDALWHPMLEKPVSNGITVDGASVLVTGSNMSGKTTFIRALGVAAVLAQSLYLVPARRWRAPLSLHPLSLSRTHRGR